jgi:HD-GYP domain-containing protein (c-di-GMP phosphodiesterase class II)
MTSSRAYRAAMTFEAAVAEVRQCAGSQFDPDVVEHMLRSSIVQREVSAE